MSVVLSLAAAESINPALLRLAVTTSPWPGAYTVWRSAAGDDFEPVQRVATAATVGRTNTMLRAGPLWRLDRAASFELSLSHGALQSVTPLSALNGANLLAIEGGGGTWEILSFLEAELLGPGLWRVQGMIRGLAGSEPHAMADKPAGSRVVVLDGALVDLATGTDSLNRRYLYRIAPEGRDHADPMAVAFEAAAGGEALAPLAPVGLKARREAAGIRFSWIRRTRFGGDNWDLADVPLNEDREGYAIDIMSGEDIKRSFNTTEPALLYPSVLEIADFGGLQSRHVLRVAQASAAAGHGRATTAELRVS